MSATNERRFLQALAKQCITCGGPIPLPPAGMGSVASYCSDICRKRKSEERRKRNREPLPRREPKPIEHDTVAGYNRGCRCPLCCYARSVYDIERKERRASQFGGDPR